MRNRTGQEVLLEVPQDEEAVKVRGWRHHLQKAFLSKHPLKEEDMPQLDQLFSTVETYENMSIKSLQFSKIGKVMNHIARLEDEKIPRDAEFGFRSRATALVTTWQQIALHDSEQDRLPSGESTVPVVSTESETRVPAITADLLPDNAVSEPGIEDAEDWVVVDKS